MHGCYGTDTWDVKNALERLDEDTTSKVEKAQTAQLLFQLGYDILKEICDEMKDHNAQAYLLDQLKIHISEDHGFLSRDLNIDKFIERIEKRYPNEKEELVKANQLEDSEDESGESS
jgi:hypothetical protein